MTTINTALLKIKIKEYVTEFHEKKQKLKRKRYEEIPFLRGFINKIITSLELVNLVKQTNIKLKTIQIGENELNCLKEPLKVKKVLGKGAFGTVFKVDNKTAVKITNLNMYQQFGLDVDKSIESEYKICRLAGELGIGPHVYDTYNCCGAFGNCYSIMYMEMIHGKTLASWLDDNHSTVEIKRVFDHLETAINTLHKNGIVHNDLHPGNIYVKQENKKVIGVYLIDFGLSSDLKNATNMLYSSDKEVLNYIHERYFQPDTEIYSYVVARLIDNKDINIV